jgi:hypothetical protein
MKGKIKKQQDSWVVEHIYYEHCPPGDHDIQMIRTYPLHLHDMEQIRKDSLIFDNIEARIAAYPNVEFELVTTWEHNITESHATSKPVEYAKLITN